MSLEMLAHPAPWHGSPLQGIVIVCSGTRRSSDSKEQVCTPMVPEEMLRTPGSLGTRERWGLEWMEPGRLDGRQQWLVCRNQMHGSCWWTCEPLDAPNPTRSSLPGWSTISYPRPPLDRCYKHVCLCNFSHYPIRVPLLQLPRSPGKLRNRKKE